MNDYFKASVDIDNELLSDNQKDKSYMLKYESYEEGDTEATTYDFDAVVELRFLIPNSDTTKYQPIIDNYIHVLVTKIKNTRTYKSSNMAIDIKKVGTADLNKFDDSEYSPKVTLKGVITEN